MRLVRGATNSVSAERQRRQHRHADDVAPIERAPQVAQDDGASASPRNTQISSDQNWSAFSCSRSAAAGVVSSQASSAASGDDPRRADGGPGARDGRRRADAVTRSAPAARRRRRGPLDEERADRQRVGAGAQEHVDRLVRRAHERLAVDVEARIEHGADAPSRRAPRAAARRTRPARRRERTAGGTCRRR